MERWSSETQRATSAHARLPLSRSGHVSSSQYHSSVTVYFGVGVGVVFNDRLFLLHIPVPLLELRQQ